MKARLALEKIAALENLVASEEDIEAEYKRIAEAYNITVEQVKESIASDAIAEDMKVKKAMDFVKEKAVIRSAAKKAPAKKATTAKSTTTKSTTAKSTTAKSTAAKSTTAKKSTSTTTKKTTAKKAETKTDAE